MKQLRNCTSDTVIRHFREELKQKLWEGEVSVLGRAPIASCSVTLPF